MAWLEQKNDGPFHAAFRFGGERFKVSLGTKNQREAQGRLNQIEDNIALVKKGRMVIPDEADVALFLLSDGKLDGKAKKKTTLRTIKQFCEAYLAGIPEGALEQNTLQGLKIHFAHLQRILGKSFPLSTLSLEDLQGYVELRSTEPGLRGRTLSATTIKKEVASLRALWLWAVHGEHISRAFPSRGIRYPKTRQKPPFQTWTEITRKIEVYDLSEDQQADLWECLFLTIPEIDALLEHVQQADHLPSCIYPMICFAAHTGARRSEILRSEIDDIDLLSRSITIREKKRARGKLTTRTVPLPPRLYEVMTWWKTIHRGIGPTFSLPDRTADMGSDRLKSVPLTLTEARDYFRLAVSNSKWSSVRGWHVFRHSFCSNTAAAGIDQRVINSWVGHQTEEMVKRYRHLVPNQHLDALARVFANQTLQEAVPLHKPLS